MPSFSWKKTRIPQLIADHLHLRKHGRSLVVETGFPTSLVDLVVKNRDRLKKPAKKKRPAVVHDPLIRPPPSSPSQSLTSNDFVAELMELANPGSRQIEYNKTVAKDVVPTKKPVAKHDGDPVIDEYVQVSDSNRVLVAILKVFFVVVLALGTKRFVVGITMSAFSLFFLEYLGKYLYRIFLQCSDAEIMLQRVLRFVRMREGKLGGEIREDSAVSNCSYLVENRDLISPASEIQIVDAKPNFVPPGEGIRNGKEHFDAVRCSKRWGFEEKETIMVAEKEEDCSSEMPELKHGNSRRAKMKLKMKKLVPKKLRKSDKKCLDAEREIEGSGEEDRCKEQEQEQEQENEMECHDKLSVLPSEMYNGEEEVINGVCTTGESSRGDFEVTVVYGEDMKETKGNSHYWVLCLIVLAGLVGGRVLALGLALSWCLTLKIGGTLHRYVKALMVRSSADTSI